MKALIVFTTLSADMNPQVSRRSISCQAWSRLDIRFQSEFHDPRLSNDNGTSSPSRPCEPRSLAVPLEAKGTDSSLDDLAPRL